MSNYTLAGLWDLHGTDDITATSSTFPIRAQPTPLSHFGNESSLFNDRRTLVAPKNYEPGGKYRCLIKLHLRYEKQGEDDPRWAVATGWLIRPDVLVTAGHCVYDWEHGDGGLGRVVRVKAYMGYTGKTSIGYTGVQLRRGSRVVTTAGWLHGTSNESTDVSFIQLETPFDGIQLSDCHSYIENPLQESATLGVVGYPANKSDELGEKGAEVHEEFDPVSHDLTKKSDHMLQCETSNFAGQSGSPVPRKSNGKALVANETPILGLGENNAASPIDGKHGNPYKDYLAVFDRQNTVINSILGVNFVRVLATNPISSGHEEIPRVGSMYSNAEDSSFFDFFGKVVETGLSLGPDILISRIPRHGPVEGPIAGIAGTMLGMAGKMAETATGSESSMQSDNFKQHASRTILGEAALQQVLKMDRETVQEFGLLDTMRTVYDRTVPLVEKIAPTILPFVEPALQTALDSIGKTNEKKGESELPPTRKMVELPESSFPTSPKSRDFLESLISKPVPVADGQESFFGSILSDGLSLVEPFQSTALKVSSHIEGHEDAVPPTESEKNLILLSKRAVMGEAALQALMVIPKESRDTEGFLDVFSQVVGTIGDQIIKTGPAVTNAASIFRNLFKR